MKQKIKSGDEYDAISRYARSITRWRKGQLKVIKRALNKRIRKEGKQCIEGSI